MRYVLSLIFLITFTNVFAQYDYAAQWSRINPLAFGEKARISLPLVAEIYRHALAEGKEDQQVKAIIRYCAFTNVLQHNNPDRLKAVTDSFVLQQKGAVKAILFSVKAAYLENYYQENQYEINSREPIAGDTAVSIKEWDKKRLLDTIAALYRASLADEFFLQEIPAERFDILMTSIGPANNTRPTLYDILAWRFAGFLKYQPQSYTDATLFAPATLFAEQRSAPELDIYRKLIRLHTARNNREALLHADIARMEQVFMLTGLLEKDSLYKDALLRMSKQYAGVYGISSVYYLLAKEHSGKEALAYCLKGMQSFPGSAGHRQCSRMHAELTQKKLGLTTEKVNIPGDPFLALVNYKNLQGIHLRLIPLYQYQKAALDTLKQLAVFNKLLTMDASRAWYQPIPDPGDYKEHTVEIKVDALGPGRYMLLASSDEQFDVANSLLAVRELSVSNIAYISTDNVHLYALHRKTGQPLRNIQLMYTNEDEIETKQLRTDRNGLVKLKFDIADEPDISLEWIDGKDTLLISDYDYLRTDNWNSRRRELDEKEDISYDDEHIRIHYYTDRVIYRPGQTLHFKGIVLTTGKQDGGPARIKKDHRAKIYLEDYHGWKVDSLVLKSNAFGSFSGQFYLPESLAGRCSISSEEEEGYGDFDVEEYKRPRFKVAFDSISTMYRTGDTVTITGYAEALAGNRLNGAKVSYKVLRGAVTRYYERDEILRKDTVADEHGRFSFRFVAEGAKRSGSYWYYIAADVTDANGETRSGNYSVSIGDVTVAIKTNFEGEIRRADLEKVRIQTTTMYQTGIAMPLKIELFPLQHPGHLMRTRYWAMPDQYIMTKELFHRYFPNDIYKDEDNKDTWPKGAPVTLAYTTGTDVPPLSSTALQTGWYEMVITGKDPYGTTVSHRQYFRLWDTADTALEYTGLHYAYKDVVVPGDKLSLELVTAGPAFLLQSIQGRSGRSMETAIHQLKGPLTVLTFPMKNSYVDHWNKFSFAYVRDNRVFTQQVSAYVSKHRQPLEVKVAAHRNKLLPGEKENWQLQVKSHGKAELLASMYDASLDEITKDDWRAPAREGLEDVFREWEGNDNFGEEAGFDNVLDPVYNIEDFYSDSLTDYMELKDVVVSGYSRKMMLTASKASFSVAAIYGSRAASGYIDMDKVLLTEVPHRKETLIIPRTNFNETAFFFPHLIPEKDGTVNIPFTIPESLTTWKFRALAHTKDVSFGLARSQVVTQKPFMIVPNPPRFLREGDEMELVARVSNVTDVVLNGNAKLVLLDAVTKQPLDAILPQAFTVAAGQSSVVKFNVHIPKGYDHPLIYRITAESGSFSDGEEAALPVLPARMMVTESMPLQMRKDGTRDFTFERLLHSDTAETLRHQGLSFSYNSSPVWSAVQSLPYLMEFPHACAEQTFARFYANALASQVVKTRPRIMQMFAEWEKAAAGQDEALKDIFPEEMPWVKDAAGEKERNKRMAMLFDLKRMGLEERAALESLKKMQLHNGAFPWFAGMRGNTYVTLHILQGFAHLEGLQVKTADIERLIETALSYVDGEAAKANENFPTLPYLYVRALFPQFKPSPATLAVMKGLLERVKKETLSLYDQGLLAMVLHYSGDTAGAQRIMQSLKENAFRSEDEGMFWRGNRPGCGWYDAPIETHSFLITAFATITKDTATIDALKTWLLRNRQTNAWNTTKATTEACYALLLTGSDWLETTPQIEISAGGKTISSSGKIFLEEHLTGENIQPSQGNIRLTVTGNGNQPSWGAVYWQYFEQLDKISSSSGALQIQRELFKKTGNTLVRIDAQHPLRIGDQVIMRIILKADRAMEFVHLKDMRPACLEPVNVLSGYKWGGGIGYYESTKDVATHFFFDRLTQGTHVLEYPLFVSHAGRFAGGISTLQCMYAPEFSAHSAGMDVEVGE